jgi:hypothetical protein
MSVVSDVGTWKRWWDTISPELRSEIEGKTTPDEVELLKRILVGVDSEGVGRARVRIHGPEIVEEAKES